MPKRHQQPASGRAAAVCVALMLAACGGADTPLPGTQPPTQADWMQATALGGATTNTDSNQTSAGFDTPAPNLLGADLALHLDGDAQFELAFTKAVNATFPLQDGVGPAFNMANCLGCHIRDGRGSFSSSILAAAPGSWSKLGADAAIFLRTSIAAGDGGCTPSVANRYCAPQAVPGFADQLFHRGVLGLRPESQFSGHADVFVRFETRSVAYGDGSTATLSRPVFEIRNPYDYPGELPGPAAASRLLQPDVAISPRMGQPMFGLGLLEAIPESAILAQADEADANGDGISGRPNWVWDAVAAARGSASPRALGRFGWKASTPSVLAQSAGAYHADMGVTNYLFPTESLVGTALHDRYLATNPADDGQAATGFEVSEDVVKQVAFYSSTLAVPARRNAGDATVLRGAQLFEQARCTACHTPSFTTGAHPGIWGPGGLTPVPQVQGQRIHPYTDLLLHDMGEDLADHRTDFAASGREWRTRPLWGIGLTHTVNALAGFLHDGRAHTLEEAILWHGGEADAAKEAFRTWSAADRAALVAFLRSL